MSRPSCRFRSRILSLRGSSNLAFSQVGLFKKLSHFVNLKTLVVFRSFSLRWFSPWQCERRCQVPRDPGCHRDMYGHFGKSQNLQLIRNHPEPGPFPHSVVFVTPKWPIKLAVFQIFILLLLLESSCHDKHVGQNPLEPGPFPRFVAFVTAKWPTCPKRSSWLFF